MKTFKTTLRWGCMALALLVALTFSDLASDTTKAFFWGELKTNQPEFVIGLCMAFALSALSGWVMLVLLWPKTAEVDMHDLTLALTNYWDRLDDEEELELMRGMEERQPIGAGVLVKDRRAGFQRETAGIPIRQPVSITRTSPHPLDGQPA